MLQDFTTTSPGQDETVLAELTRLETQASLLANGFTGGMASKASPDGMLYWLAATCYEARIAANTKAVRIAASVQPEPVNEATIVRFERGAAWPRNTDRFIDAYADELDREPAALWAEALQRWQAHQKQVSDPRENAAEAAEEAARRTRERRRATGAGSPGQRRRAQAG